MQQSDVDQFRTLEVPAQKLFINGKWVEGCGKPFVTTSPINGHKLVMEEQELHRKQVLNMLGYLGRWV